MPSKVTLPARRREQPDDHPRDRRLAGAGFAHQRQRLAAPIANDTSSTALRNGAAARSITRLSHGLETSNTRLTPRTSTSGVPSCVHSAVRSS